MFFTVAKSGGYVNDLNCTYNAYSTGAHTYMYAQYDLATIALDSFLL